jgi:hypothetical protein
MSALPQIIQTQTWHKQIQVGTFPQDLFCWLHSSKHRSQKWATAAMGTEHFPM